MTPRHTGTPDLFGGGGETPTAARQDAGDSLGGAADETPTAARQDAGDPLGGAANETPTAAQPDAGDPLGGAADETTSAAQPDAGDPLGGAADETTSAPQPAPGEAPPGAATYRARVLLSEPVGLLDYSVPAALAGALRKGSAVRVPLGTRHTSGYVAELVEGPAPSELRLRPVEGLDAERPALTAGLIDLVLFAADYYGAPPGEVLACALPPAARTASRRYRITAAGREALDGPRLTPATPVAPDGPRLTPADRALLELARRFDRGFGVTAVERELAVGRRTATQRMRRQLERGLLQILGAAKGPRDLTAFERTGGDPSVLGARQRGARELLARIPVQGTVLASELALHDPNAYPRLRALEKAGLVQRVLEPQRLRPHPSQAAHDAPPEPTGDQARAIAAVEAALDEGAYRCFLLHGITGSGKTEVYMRVIERALALERTALVLVPEIALTPQLGARFRARFGDRVATFHSGLTAAERRDERERVQSGEATIGLGARSAIFLPLERLGVVIVDEEHETSFKQEESPRYNARDLAVVRAHRDGAVVVLGSATPSLESWTNAASGRYARLSLPERVQARPLPEVECVSLALEERVGEGLFTRRLAGELDRTLSAGQQAVLFLNRRGFAPYVNCRDCGHAFRCPDCEVSLTLHRRRGVLLCHYCGFEEPAPDRCPSCDGHRVDSFGGGTERIESELVRLFGDVPLVRLDRDTVRRRSDLDQALARFGRGEARLLIGTQMVAKGHDFPGVTLVGVVAADASLNFPDFRAAERTFQLLTQVAGRAGRGELPGRVLVQAYETEHYAVRAASAHDFEAFAEQELAFRRELQYPPFAHLALLRFEAAEQEEATRAAAGDADRLRERAAAMRSGVRVLGPAPAPLVRLRGMWRVQVLLKAASRPALRGVLAGLPRPAVASVRRILDVDPLSML